MPASAFVDTNVLVYAFDDDEPAKRDRARQVLAEDPARLVLSAQVLGEFYVVTTRKLARPLSEADAATAVEQWSRLRAVPLDGALVRSAVATSRTDGISYWDALIVAAAATAGCEQVLTEDLAHGTSLAGVRIEDPFRELSAEGPPEARD